MKKDGIKLVANNKKAYHDYFIIEKYEAGLALVGTEVKSLRAGKCSIKEAYVHIEDGEAYVVGMNISPYDHSSFMSLMSLMSLALLTWAQFSWKKSAQD